MRLPHANIWFLPAALLLGALTGCAPERIIITDADDLARFAAASKAAADKKAVGAKTATESAPIAGANDLSGASKLDADSQAFLERAIKEQNLDPSEIAAYRELLTSLPPQIRATWLATQEATAKQSQPISSAPPRELPPVVRAKPLVREPSEIQQADYRAEMPENEAELAEPTPSNLARGNSLSFKEGELLTALQEVAEQIARDRVERKEQQAVDLLRDEEQKETDRRNSMLEVIRSDSARNSLVTDESPSSILGGGSGLGNTDLVAAIMKTAPRGAKKSPLPPSVPASRELSTPPASSSAPLAAQKLDELWSQIAGENASDPSLSLAMRKKIFLLAAGDADAASSPPEGLTSEQQGYWKHFIRSLEMTFKLGEHPRGDRHAALVGRELREAVAELEAASVLDLQNAAFCSSVQAFGNYVEFESTHFKPDDEVILYVELQNFASRERADGKAFETEFQGTYQVLDAAGKRVADHDLPTEHGVCRQRRRDYFLAYRVHIPKNLADGSYTLQLTLEDKISGKFGQTTLKFMVQK